MAGILMMFLGVSLLRLPLTSAEYQTEALTKRLGAQTLQAIATRVASAQHQQNPPVSGQDRGAEQNDVVMSGADFLVRQMNEIRTASGDVIRMMRQLEGNHWDMVAMTGIEQVRQNLEGLRQETERRTNLLATGLTTAVAAVDQLREAAVQSNQAYGSLSQRVDELTENMKNIAHRVDGLEGQVFLHEAMSQQLSEIRDRVLGLESRCEAERETFLKQNKKESDKLWLRILDLQEVVQKLQSRPLEEESRRSKELASVMERVVETQRICKQLRARDEEIQGHLSHILSRERKPDASVPTREHEVQDKGPSGVQTFNMTSGTPLRETADDDRDQWWDAYDEKPIQEWYGHPPGLDNGTWAPSAPPPALPRDIVTPETSSAAGHALQLESKDLRVQGCQWKLLNEDPRAERPGVGKGTAICAVCHGNGLGRDLCGVGFRSLCEVSN